MLCVSILSVVFCVICSLLMFWLMFMGRVFVIFSASCLLYSAGSGVSTCCFVWVDNEIVCLCPSTYFM